MSPWDRLLAKPGCGHLVQLYQRTDESPLIRNVGLYLSEGLNRGEAALAITTAEHQAFLNQELESLEIDTRAAARKKQLVWLDAQETLSRFIMSGWPDWNRFELTVGALIRDLEPAEENAGLRAYGEMVDILWKNRQFAAALRLEHFWNKLLSRSPFSLYCAYSVDALDQKSSAGNLHEVLSTHTHILPGESQPRAYRESALPIAVA